jgi:uncharacterized membrane protein
MKNLLKSLLANERGNVLVLTASGMVFVIGMVAMVVDVGSFYYQKRRLQTAADMAAMAAGSDVANASAAALAALSSNGYSAATLQDVTTGVYNSSASLGNRFTPGATNANAAKVTLLTYAPMQFSKIFQLAGYPTSAGTVAIKAAGVGSAAANASFEIGSTLASLNGGVLNAVFGALLGGNVSLQLMDYNSLLSANIDLFQFANALATRVNLTGPTYNSVASGSFTLGDVLQAAITTAQTEQDSSTAIAAMQTLYRTLSSSALGKTVSLSSLVNFGPYGGRSIGPSGPVAAQISALNFVSGVLQIANEKNQLSFDLGVNIPPVSSVTLTLAIGEPPVGSSQFVVGASGASAFTSQTRLLFTAQIAAQGLSSKINLPILLDVASGQATLAGVSCNAANMPATTVTLNVSPSIANAWVGNVTNAMLYSLTTPPNPPAATILTLANIATVTARANAAISNLSPTPVNFTYAQIQSAAGQNTSTTDYVSSLLSNLFQNMVLNVTALGLPALVPPGLTTTIATTLVSATAPLDVAISSTLTALGISLGQATTWVTGVGCGAPTIVQ